MLSLRTIHVPLSSHGILRIQNTCSGFGELPLQQQKVFQKASFQMSSVTQKQNKLFFYMIVVQSILPILLLHIPGLILFFSSAFTVLPQYASASCLDSFRDVLDMLMMTSLTCPAMEPLIVIFFLTKGKFFSLKCHNYKVVRVSLVSKTPQSAAVQ